MDDKEFKLEEIKRKPTKELTSHEFYLRYKKCIKRNNKKNYSKYKFGKYVKKYADKNKEKIKAKDKANYYVPIPINTICQRCLENKATQRHHKDYSKILEVQFLCRDCHAEVDRERRQNE